MELGLAHDGFLIQIEAFPLETGSPREYPERQVARVTPDGGLVHLDCFSIPQSVVDQFISQSSLARGMTPEDFLNSLPGNYGVARGKSYMKRAVFNLSEHIGCNLRHAGLDVNRLRQLKIVDFGCGADHPISTEEGLDHSFKPWLCRGLFALGVDVTGVDVEYPRHDSEGKGYAENWSFIIEDLSQPDALSIIPKNSVDVVNCSALIGVDDPCLTSPIFRYRSFNNNYHDLEARIVSHALRILKNGGLFVVNNFFVYQKIGGPLLFSFKEIHDKGPQRIENIQHVDRSFLVE